MLCTVPVKHLRLPGRLQKGPICMSSDHQLEVVVGRQSVHNEDGRVVGYELLFRALSGALPGDSADSGDQMTSSVLFSALNIGLERLVEDNDIYCNADRGLLTGSIPITLPPERTVIEVRATESDAEILAGCRRLADFGYRIAVDDFRWFDGVESLLSTAWLVKIDIRGADDNLLVDLLRRCRPFGVQTLADKVETNEELARCRALGFDLFQGYALSRPQLVPGRAAEPSDLSRARMATLLLDDFLEIDELEDILRTEPALTYQILQIASLGRPRETRRPLRTIRDALIYAGTWRIQNWLALLIARPNVGASRNGITTALQRARCCELLATSLDRSLSRIAFAAGMLSAFDILLGVPADELVTSLPLADELRAAAFTTTTELGLIVHDIARLQTHGDLDGKLSNIPAERLYEASAQAFTWANDVTAAVCA
jgi:EAL and modified HD-GYP domain-containing signal transduction protein